jgi:hypothetical protein
MAEEIGVPSLTLQFEKAPLVEVRANGAFHPGAGRIWCRHAIGASLSIRRACRS